MSQERGIIVLRMLVLFVDSLKLWLTLADGAARRLKEALILTSKATRLTFRFNKAYLRLTSSESNRSGARRSVLATPPDRELSGGQPVRRMTSKVLILALPEAPKKVQFPRNGRKKGA